MDRGNQLMNNESQTETKTEIIQPAEPTEPVERQDVVVEVTGFQLEIIKGL
jgi:hypothetical protein